MRLVIVSGFLGSGKTTLIIQLAKAAVAKQIKVAVLVNEVGEIGIDDQYMRRMGLNVWEILGGCICCTLAGNLNETLDMLMDHYQPDVVLLEPSGVADLRSVDGIIASYEKKDRIDTFKTVILDPLRLTMLLEVLTPLVESQIRSAQLVLINKQDLASEQQMKQASEEVARIQPKARIEFASLKRDLSPAVIEALLIRQP